MDVATLSSSIPLLAAIGLGLLCAVSPCTMATNVAALAYVGGKATQRGYAMTTAVLYTLGRMFSYTLLGVLIVLVGLEVNAISRFLQGAGSSFLGPFLIVIGALLLVIDRLPAFRSGGGLSRLGAKFGDLGVLGGFPLGALFALAFCPYSAVLFFVVLIPIALNAAGGLVLPAVFAVGTGVPVLAFGALLSAGASRATSLMNTLTRADRVVRIVVAVVFIGAGIYCMLSV
jgi:cytochrome c biogenesis protein CcdA